MVKNGGKRKKEAEKWEKWGKNGTKMVKNGEKWFKNGKKRKLWKNP